jgi:DNA processing protein
MEDFPIESINPLQHFPQLKEIPQPPTQLYMRGSLERCIGTTFLAVVGSRKFSSYGKQVCEQLIKGLANYPITIVSGLAYGIDAIAHQAAIDAGLPTVAFPGSGLNWNVIHPKRNRELAYEILKRGGALLSEFPHDIGGRHWMFPQRNRLEAGIVSMVLIIEAEEQSGTLITARLGTEYNKVVGVVPGPITSASSIGANWLLRLGAVPITSSADILDELGFSPPGQLPFRFDKDAIGKQNIVLDQVEQRIIIFLSSPQSKETIIDSLELDIVTASIAFSTLEIKGAIKETYGLIERTI